MILFFSFVAHLDFLVPKHALLSFLTWSGDIEVLSKNELFSECFLNGEKLFGRGLKVSILISVFCLIFDPILSMLGKICLIDELSLCCWYYCDSPDCTTSFLVELLTINIRSGFFLLLDIFLFALLRLWWEAEWLWWEIC